MLNRLWRWTRRRELAEEGTGGGRERKEELDRGEQEREQGVMAALAMD